MQNPKPSNAQYAKQLIQHEVISNSTCINTLGIILTTANIVAKVLRGEANTDITCYAILANHRTYAKTVVEDFGRNVTSKFTAQNTVAIMHRLDYRNARYVTF